METTAARGGPDDGGAGREGRRRHGAARTAARDRTGGGGARQDGRGNKPFGCSVPTERLGLSAQPESAQPGLLAHPNRALNGGATLSRTNLHDVCVCVVIASHTND